MIKAPNTFLKFVKYNKGKMLIRQKTAQRSFLLHLKRYEIELIQLCLECADLSAEAEQYLKRIVKHFKPGSTEINLIVSANELCLLINTISQLQEKIPYPGIQNDLYALCSRLRQN